MLAPIPILLALLSVILPTLSLPNRAPARIALAGPASVPQPVLSVKYGLSSSSSSSTRVVTLSSQPSTIPSSLKKSTSVTQSPTNRSNVNAVTATSSRSGSSKPTSPSTTTLTTTPRASTIVSQTTSATASYPSGKPGSLEYLALDAHNKFRASHGANPLIWSTDLVAAAQIWADRCVWKHSHGAVGPFGENLAATAGYQSTITDGIAGWSNEAPDYNATNPIASHFTQEVWKASTLLGCAAATCPPGAPGPFDASYGKWTFYVCEYNPPGNVVSPAQFKANVQA